MTPRKKKPEITEKKLEKLCELERSSRQKRALLLPPRSKVKMFCVKMSLPLAARLVEWAKKLGVSPQEILRRLFQAALEQEKGTESDGETGD